MARNGTLAGAGCIFEIIEDRRLVWMAARGPGFRAVVSDSPVTAIFHPNAVC